MYIKLITFAFSKKARKITIMRLISGNITADAALGAGMGLLGNLFGRIGQKRRQKNAKELMQLQNQYELERMEQQFGYNMEAAAKEQQYAIDMFNHQFRTQSQWNEKMLEDQRKYDSPEEEMKRLEAAGINPATYYAGGGGGAGGSGIGAMGVSASGGGASVSGVSGIQPMAVQVGLQAQMQQEQVSLIRAQAAKTFAEAANTVGINREEKKQNIEESKSKILLNKAQEAKTYEDLKKVTKEIELVMEQTRKEDSLADMSEMDAEMHWQNLTTAYHSALANFQNLVAQNDVIKGQAKLNETQQKVLDKELGAFDKKLELLEEQVSSGRITAEAAREQAETAAKKAESEIVKNYTDAGVSTLDQGRKILELGKDMFLEFVGIDKKGKNVVKRMFKRK